MKYLYAIVLIACGPFHLLGQVGPLSPSSGTNNSTTGTIAWNTPENITASDNAYASVSTSANTNYLFGTNFGFAIPSPANIDGIRVDIEKKELSPNAISNLNDWSNGLTKTISAGTNRCLIVVAAIENGNGIRDITSINYGGMAMTQVLEIVSGNATGYSNKLEVWMLLESEISSAVGTTIAPTYAAGTLLEDVEFYTSVVFQNVDQTSPIYSSQITASNSSTNPHQLAAPFNTLISGMSVAGVICGNNTTPAITSGATNTYSINSSFVEGADIYLSNPSAPTSGCSVETSTKACTVSGTEQPSFTFAGTVNRASMFGFTLQRARALDNSVFLLKANVPAGENKAPTAISWPTTDTYVSYGNSTDLWGTNWNLSDINNAGFGVALSASKHNGNLQVDHFRITVYTTSTLPIELLEFTVAPSGNQVIAQWVTATEQNNNYFEVERTTDGLTFKSIGLINGFGNSSSPHSYEMKDTTPVSGVAYYRLKQVDFNGEYSYSPFVTVSFHPNAESTIYPNPSVDGVFTFLQKSQYTCNEVAIFSADLKLVKKIIVAPGEKAIISIADQPEGIYFLIYEENGLRQVTKVQKISREN